MKNLQVAFTNYFVNNSQIHKYNTRNNTKLHKSYKRTNYVKHTLSYKGIDIWNELDSNLENITYIMFKNAIKEHKSQNTLFPSVSVNK